MEFTRTEFDALVARMENRARQDPAAYRRRVLAWAALGYGYLGVLVMVLTGLTVVAAFSVVKLKALGIKLLLVVGALLYAVLRSLIVRLPPPEGLRLSREQVPQLFEVIDLLQRQLSTVPIHEVLLTGEFNAGVAQIPRLGVFGWHRNVLLLGLPLLKSLTVEQFEAVLAHEFGHLSRGHARVSNGIYRLRRIWQRLADSLRASDTSGSGVVWAFLGWYAPRFSAISFPLARANEYEADAVSAQATSPRVAAQALTGVHLLDRYYSERYWPAVHATARHVPEPVAAPYAAYVAEAVKALPGEERQRWQHLALTTPTSAADTHPCLADRLAALGATAEFVPPAAGREASTLLGAALPGLQDQLDEQWRSAVFTSWRENHQQAHAAQERLAQLRSPSTEPSLSEALELANLEEYWGAGEDEALRIRRAMVERHPDDPNATFELGRHLLRNGDDEGLTLLKHASERDALRRGEIAELIVRHLRERGRAEEAEQWVQVSSAENDTHAAARAERDTVQLGDLFLHHGLEPTAVDRLVGQLRGIPGLRRVLLVRKELRYFPELPLYVLAFSCTPVWRFTTAGRIRSYVERLTREVTLPGECFVVCTDGEFQRFHKRLRQVKGSRLL